MLQFPAVSATVATVVALALLSGCAGANVAVRSTGLPVPVVEPLPIAMGIQLSDELRSFTYEENIRNYGKFKLAVGPAQDLMFNNLADGMFTSHRLITSASSPASEQTGSANTADLDAILIPRISELQFSIPAQTKSDFFEVWINYNFRLQAPDGTPIAEWPMKAYGRANSRNYGFLEDTDKGALQEAARVALRDAMAVFTFKFKRVPAVQQWLQQYTGRSSPGSATTQDTATNSSGTNSGGSL